MESITLNDLELREPMKGYKGHFVHSAHSTFVHWDIDPGSPLPEHSHPHEQVVNVIEGEFELTIDGETERLKSGTMAIIPGNAIHSGKAITRCYIIDVFHPIREDYR